MKKVLVPVSFSASSKNALQHAVSIFDKAKLTLLNVYPVQSYSRKYDFGTQKYSVGMREKLRTFYQQQLDEPDNKPILSARMGVISDIIDTISNRYDLMVMSREVHSSTENGYFSERKLSIITKAHCPALIMPITSRAFQFEKCNHIWHINRKESEAELVAKGMKKLNITPDKVETKSLQQTNFLSAFWQNIVNYENSHDKKLLKKIDEAHDLEPIDLIILVDNEPSVFTRFFDSEVIHLFCKYNIPILIFPAK